MGNHLFVIFAVLDVSLAVNLCINCSFFTFMKLIDSGPSKAPIDFGTNWFKIHIAATPGTVCLVVFCTNFYASANLDRRRHNVLDLSVRLFVSPIQTCKHDVLKKNEPILLQIGENGLQSREMKLSTLRVRIEVTRC